MKIFKKKLLFINFDYDKKNSKYLTKKKNVIHITIDNTMKKYRSSKNWQQYANDKGNNAKTLSIT